MVLVSLAHHSTPAAKKKEDKKQMKKVGLQNRFFIAFLEFLGDLIFSRKFFEIYSPPVTMHTTQCHAFEPAVTAREPHQRNVCEYLHIRDIVHRDSTPEIMTFECHQAL